MGFGKVDMAELCANPQATIFGQMNEPQGALSCCSFKVLLLLNISIDGMKSTDVISSLSTISSVSLRQVQRYPHCLAVYHQRWVTSQHLQPEMD